MDPPLPQLLLLVLAGAMALTVWRLEGPRLLSQPGEAAHAALLQQAKLQLLGTRLGMGCG